MITKKINPCPIRTPLRPVVGSDIIRGRLAKHLAIASIRIHGCQTKRSRGFIIFDADNFPRCRPIGVPEIRLWDTCQFCQARPIGMDFIKLRVIPKRICEANPIPARRPRRIAFVSRQIGQLLEITAIRPHEPKIILIRCRIAICRFYASPRHQQLLKPLVGIQSCSRISYSAPGKRGLRIGIRANPKQAGKRRPQSNCIHFFHPIFPCCYPGGKKPTSQTKQT